MKQLFTVVLVSLSVLSSAHAMEQAKTKRKQLDKPLKSTKKRRQVDCAVNGHNAEIEYPSWHTLPPEIQEHVMSVATQTKDPLESLNLLGNVKLVCKSFKQAAQSPRILKSIAKTVLNKDLKTAQAVFLNAAGSGDYAIVQAMLDAGINIETQNNAKRTALSIALIKHNTDIAKLLIERKANLMHTDIFGQSILHYAIAHNDRDLTSLILAHNKQNLFYGGECDGKAVHVNMQVLESCFTAVIMDDTELVKHLVNSPLPFIRQTFTTWLDRKGNSALAYACINGNVEIVNLLMTIRPSFNEDILARLLFFAVVHGHTEVVKLLFACGATVDGGGNNCFALAVDSDQTHVVQLLIDYGISIDGELGNIAFLNATYYGHKELVKLFLHYGIDVNTKNTSGLTPLMVAASNGHYNIAQLLLSMRADPNINDNKNYSALCFAIQGGHVKIVELLLRSGADVNGHQNPARLPHALPPLTIAAAMGSKELVQLLIGWGAKMDSLFTGESVLWIPTISQRANGVCYKKLTIRANGSTALAVAASLGWKEIVELLIDNYEPADWHHAAQAAKSNQHEDIYLLLINHEKDLTSSWLNDEEINNILASE